MQSLNRNTQIAHYDYETSLPQTCFPLDPPWDIKLMSLLNIFRVRLLCFVNYVDAESMFNKAAKKSKIDFLN